MKAIEENEFLSSLCKEFNIELPINLQNREIYKEIENFKEAEYIYCIAYEMLIRTDEYNRLLKEYKPLKNKSKYDMTNEEFLKLRELIRKMNQLGLKKTSFLGFDNENDDDHVFKMIEYYDEVSNSPWNVRMLHKFESDSDENIFYLLAKFYLEKGELYKLDNYLYTMPPESKELVLDYIKKNSKCKTQEEYNEFYSYLNDFYIPCTNEITGEIEYKSLASDSIYLKELDKKILSMIKEKKNNNLLIQIQSNFTKYNMEFWNKFYVNDIKDGLKKLIKFHLENKLIFDKNLEHKHASINEILDNPSDYYIPCVNRLNEAIEIEWNKKSNLDIDNNFINKLKFDGNEAVIGNMGYIKFKTEENIYFVQLSENISLSLLDDSFLETIAYEDLKNIYIDTEPKFSRPRLMFDEARLTNIPINLNLSKEDLLHYISQIKDEYDRDKNIVKTLDEYFFDLPLESDFTVMPKHIKLAYDKRINSDKKIFPIKRVDFHERIACSFYIYDIYKLFIPYLEKKRNNIINERDTQIAKEKNKKGIYEIFHDKIDDIIKNAQEQKKYYLNECLITEISYLVEENKISKEQVKYYLSTMKEFIHGINLEGENNFLKKVYNPEVDEKRYPKYKDLIIGNSYITKSNKEELISLFN
ncbi:hypothetical protein [Arcobacter porcinus]|uniref:Uncharacterized protein n=1 Tax=Arcobacter porcinus TaxID=1935204 RepID=A0A5C2HFG6_9BACT|nr:hypothetical protein [Arcobacter porcinus]OCL90719.1 hypothetical protein AAX27_01530 [Aliarcobacter thereius]QEP40874.1 hypothetical protein APORC_1279 [Arcobacter porcinus]